MRTNFRFSQKGIKIEALRHRACDGTAAWDYFQSGKANKVIGRRNFTLRGFKGVVSASVIWPFELFYTRKDLKVSL